MPVEIGIWRIDGPKAVSLPNGTLDDEARLERALLDDIKLLGLGDLLILSYQVWTDHHKKIDVLAIDAEGELYVIELKHERTPRDIVAQVLDYGSWARRLGAEEIVQIFESSPLYAGATFEDTFTTHFDVDSLPETLGASYELIIVASELDAGTERIVKYLQEDFRVPLNAVFFRYFQDGPAEYLALSWLVDPVEAESKTKADKRVKPKEPFSAKDYYVCLGEDEARTWEDARRYRFVSAGGGPRYRKAMSLLQPGHTVFVLVPGAGYVAAGVVKEAAVPARKFTVSQNGSTVSILDPSLNPPINAPEMDRDKDNDEMCEYLVRVDWTKAVPKDQGFWEPGLLRIPSTAARLRENPNLAKLREHFGVKEEADSDPTSEVP